LWVIASMMRLHVGYGVCMTVVGTFAPNNRHVS
jgi:hypothetical protein